MRAWLDEAAWRDRCVSEDSRVNSEDNATTARMGFLISVSCFAAFASLCVLLVNNLLGLDGHVHDIGSFGLESAFLSQLATVATAHAIPPKSAEARASRGAAN
jgi:hypothetical protein